RDDTHGGRLAGAVRAEEADALAGLDGEAHVLDGGEVAKLLGEVGYLDHRGAAGSPCTRRVGRGRAPIVDRVAARIEAALFRSAATGKRRAGTRDIDLDRLPTTIHVCCRKTAKGRTR